MRRRRSCASGGPGTHAVAGLSGVAASHRLHVRCTSCDECTADA
ncbi:hypothetical protein ACFPM0_24925 [Pseudonocardia sulfidoxydans]